MRFRATSSGRRPTAPEAEVRAHPARSRPPRYGAIGAARFAPRGADSLGGRRRSSTRAVCRRKSKARHKRLAIELGFSAMDVPAAHGGRDARVVDQVAVWEQLGARDQRALLVLLRAASLDVRGVQPGAARALRAAAHERQAQGMLRDHRERPGIGRRVDRDDRTRAARRLPDFAARSGTSPARTTPTYFILQARLADGPHAGAHSLFFIDKDQPGIELVRTPPFSHTFSDHHPIYRFNDVAGAGSAAPRHAKATACSTRTAGSAANG